MAARSSIDISATATRGGRKRRDQRTLTLLIVGRITGRRYDGLCRIRNISAGGLMAEICTSFDIGEPVRIELRNGQSANGVVRWMREDELGIQFEQPLADIRQFLAEPKPTAHHEDIPLIRSPRLPTDCSADILVDGHHHHAVVTDLSQGGARIASTASLASDGLLVLTIAGLPPLHAAVRWVGTEGAGVAFLDPLAFAPFAQWLGDPALRYNRRN